MGTSNDWTKAHERAVALVLLNEARTLLLDGDPERARDAANEATGVLGGGRDHAGTSAERCVDVAVSLGLSGGRILRRVCALATATPEALAMIDAADKDHARVVRKLASGRYVRETSLGVRRDKATRKAWKAVLGLPLRSLTEARSNAKACGGVAIQMRTIRRARSVVGGAASDEKKGGR